MAGQGEPKEPEEAKLTEAKKARLEAEYRECSEDWRLRDKYVLDKLPAAGILFGLLGVALGTLPPETHLIKVLLVLIGGLFSIVLSISVAKDTYYRDGTEKLLRHLSARLGINNSLQTLKSLEDFEDLQFTRKIKIKRDRYSLRLPSTASNNNLYSEASTFSHIQILVLSVKSLLRCSSPTSLRKVWCISRVLTTALSSSITVPSPRP